MTDLIDAQGFRANVGIVLIRDSGDVFLGGRRDGRGWRMTACANRFGRGAGLA